MAGYDALLVLFALLVASFLLRLAVLVLTGTADAAKRRGLRRQGCYCGEGLHGFHLADCPLANASDRAGA